MGERTKSKPLYKDMVDPNHKIHIEFVTGYSKYQIPIMQGEIENNLPVCWVKKKKYISKQDDQKVKE